MSSWMVVSTVKDSLGRLRRLAEHHLNMGAAGVTYFFDDPDDQAADGFYDISEVTAVRCDEAFWRGERPRVRDVRQISNIRRAFSEARCEWVAHIDSDEAFISDEPIGDILERQKPKILQLRAPALERVFRVGEGRPPLAKLDGFYRRPVRTDRQEQLLTFAMRGARRHLKSNGLFGHVLGKSFFRTSAQDLQVSLHNAEGLERRRRRVSNKIRLLHMIVDSPEALMWKLSVRLKDLANADPNSSVRKREGGIRELVQLAGQGEDGEREAKRIFSEAFELNFVQRLMLRRAGLLEKISIDGDIDK